MLFRGLDKFIIRKLHLSVFDRLRAVRMLQRKTRNLSKSIHSQVTCESKMCISRHTYHTVCEHWSTHPSIAQYCPCATVMANIDPPQFSECPVITEKAFQSRNARCAICARNQQIEMRPSLGDFARNAVSKIAAARQSEVEARRRKNLSLSTSRAGTTSSINARIYARGPTESILVGQR